MSAERLIEIGLGFVVLLMGLTILLLFRNQAVSRYRLQLLNKIAEINQNDIRRGELETWVWRFHEFSRITYEQMLFRLWKPVHSFYDESILLGEATPMDITRAKNGLRAGLKDEPGVAGIGIAEDQGELVLVVYVLRGTTPAIPDMFAGYRVKMQHTGPIQAFDGGST